MGTPQNPDFDYIVIGSGAGGGPVACNLAKAGYKVGLLEAGQAPEPPCYSVPVFHAFASEDPTCRGSSSSATMGAGSSPSVTTSSSRPRTASSIRAPAPWAAAPRTMP